MIPKLQLEIDAEIKLLEELLPRVKPRTMFGDSNTDAIAAQIKVLKERMALPTIADRYMPSEDTDDGRTTEIFDAALQAHAWLIGSSMTALSDDWAGLVE